MSGKTDPKTKDTQYMPDSKEKQFQTVVVGVCRLLSSHREPTKSRSGPRD